MYVKKEPGPCGWHGVKGVGMEHVSGMCMSRRTLFGLGASAFATCALAGCSSDSAGGSASVDKTGERTVIPTAESVRIIGRTFEEEGTLWLPQSGSAIEFVSNAARLKLEIVGDESVENEPDLCPRFAVLVDHEVVVDDALSEPSRVVEIPLDDPDGEPVVEVIHLSEASRGAVGVRNITVESDPDAPVVPTEAKDLSISFVGDSITCAYGVEASGNDDPFKTTTENFLKSYAYLTAQELAADYETVCYSGYGVVSGWSGDGARNESMLLPPLYELVAEGHEYAWDFAAHSCDVVVVNLGTNDFTYTGTDEARMQEFSQGYATLLDRIRELNPDSLIVCTLGTMWGSEALYPALEQAVEDHVGRTGDARIMCYLSDPINEETDSTVANGHPDPEGQRKIASKLIRVIQEALGA